MQRIILRGGEILSIVLAYLPLLNKNIKGSQQEKKGPRREAESDLKKGLTGLMYKPVISIRRQVLCVQHGMNSNDYHSSQGPDSRFFWGEDPNITTH